MKKAALVGLVVVVLATVAWIYVKPRPSNQRVLNLLCWSGYEDPMFIKAFEDQYKIKVNAKTFFGGDGMMALLTQSPGTYDVVVVDKDYLQKLYEARLLTELRESDYDFSNYWPVFQDASFARRDGRLYGVPVEFGTSVIAYNSTKLTNADVGSYDVLWNDKVRGKVGIWDWYLPTMGVVSLSLGNSKPFDITDQQLKAVRERLFELRPQVAAFHTTPTEIISGLATEDTWIVPGAGEWLASIMAQQGHPINWVIPKEGGLIWIDTLVIPVGAPNPESARTYIQWMQTPEAQVFLSQKSSFNANVMNRAAYDLLTPEQRKILRVESATDVDEMLSNVTDRTLPVQQTEAVWQGIWEEFKARK